ncbi:hypothetical protein [Mucilaginibacter lacusdianchii]|uniref:hypothetical protein n=1 Tax=Mucilaginibacter lacusdianchii TaxID=2684211 RepID=UPI00131ECC2C|nr:hypothetical protein [Mucilaginibacter sp. JXJ CY 39]
MKPKIFNLKPLALIGLLMVAHAGFAQQASGSTDTSKDYHKQMDDLRSQMRDLQKQMSKLQSEEFKKQAKTLQESTKLQSEEFRKQAKALQESAKKLRESAQYYSYDLSDLNKNLGNLNGLGISPNIHISPIAPLTPATGFNFNYSDADIRKQIQTGELKEKVKTYSKSYSVDRDDKLQISNRYGKVTVNTWNKNEVKVDVEIKAIANEEDQAQKLLDQVSITDSKENSLVSFKTNIESSSNRTFVIGTLFNGSKTTVRRMEVNYTVYMPTRNQLQVSNRYGATILPDLSGKVIIDNAYGSFVAKNLSNPGNEIVVKYGSADIENLNSGELNIAYGSLKLGEADKLNANVSYSSATIGRLKTSGTLNIRYCGGLNIADLDKNLRNLSVTSSYSNVKVGLAENDNADFDITTHYGSFNYGDKVINIVNKTPGDEERGWTSTKTYKGKVGKGNADKLIVIRSNYGSVKFD